MQNQLLIPEYILAKCKANRRQIHENPEIGFEVQQTAALVQQELEALGLKVYTEIGRTGLYADLIVPNATKHIGFRADMDALEIQEENEVSYRSKIPGRGHLCGHDAHTAMLLAAASYLVAHKANLKQSIRFIFQPNEENIPGGAVEILCDSTNLMAHRKQGFHVVAYLAQLRVVLLKVQFLRTLPGRDESGF